MAAFVEERRVIDEFPTREQPVHASCVTVALRIRPTLSPTRFACARAVTWKNYTTATVPRRCELRP